MPTRSALRDYTGNALARSVFGQFGDGSFYGRIRGCTGVLAFAPSLRECETELRSVLEDWILVGLEFGHSLPVLAGIDLSREPPQ